MNNDMFDNLSRSAQEQTLLQNEILQGIHGKPGDVFMTTRALAAERQVSLVTAHNILNGLCSSGYLELRSKKYYLAHDQIIKDHKTQSQVIGLLVPDLNNEFFSSLTEAIIEQAKIRDYSVLVMSTSFSSEEEAKALKLFEYLSVAGIINGVPTNPELVQLYRDLKTPCVFAAHVLDGIKKSSVRVNSFSTCQKIANHLIEQGYENFLYIGSSTMSLDQDMRLAAFKMGLNQNGYRINPANIIQITSGVKREEDVLYSLLKTQEYPVGVFCFHDLIAVHLYRVCMKLGLRIPEDVGIVGFDDLTIASLLSPPLTTVRYRISTMADITLQILFNCMNNPDAPYDNYYVDPTLVIRNSSQRLTNS